jgi:hypothetical protein
VNRTLCRDLTVIFGVSSTKMAVVIAITAGGGETSAIKSSTSISSRLGPGTT